MVLIPANHKLPPVYTNDGKPHEEIPVPIKLFNPCGSQTWYLTEYDEEDRRAYCYVTGMDYDEFGYVSIDELEGLRLPFGLGIERDLHWDETTTIAEVIAGTKR